MIKTKNVYFDTSAWDHLYKKVGISESDSAALVSAVKTHKMSVLPSITNLEEVVCALKSCPDLAIAELRFILGLADSQRLLKSHDLLLSDDIKSYALTGFPSKPFLEDSVIRLVLCTLQNPTRKDRGELLSVVKATQRQKEVFTVATKEVKRKSQSEAKKLKGGCSSFDDCWERLAYKVAEDFAECVGVLDACKKRGIESLLEVRSVRLVVGITLSLMYAQIFEERPSDMGDSRDIHHAILASAADGFATEDKQFAKLLSRVPTEGFQVMNLNDLLELIR